MILMNLIKNELKLSIVSVFFLFLLFLKKKNLYVQELFKSEKYRSFHTQKGHGVFSGTIFPILLNTIIIFVE